MFKSDMDVLRIEYLEELNKVVSQNSSFTYKIVPHLLDKLIAIEKVEAGAICFYEEKSFLVYLKKQEYNYQKFIIKDDRSPFNWSLKSSSPLIINDFSTDERFENNVYQDGKVDIQSILSVPILSFGKSIGSLTLINPLSNELFNNYILKWLELYSFYFGQIIQNLSGGIKDAEAGGIVHERPFLGSGELAKQLLSNVYKMGASNSSVMVLGESGTGKELIARYVHEVSLRRENSFISVNCASISENLLESELFGHVKGAYTDAHKDRKGRFELADNGTLFLDEIGDLPLALQAKLLRVLQTGIFEPVGSSESKKVDVRVVCATNKDLEKEVMEGKFRKDLFYRLNVFIVRIPPLRERKEDISEIADFFLKKYSENSGRIFKGISKEAIQRLMAYDWPGNVRELENTIERAVVFAKNDYVDEKSIFLKENNSSYQDSTLKNALNDFKKKIIKERLVLFDNKKIEVAKSLDIQRTYLSRLIKELNINVRRK